MLGGDIRVTSGGTTFTVQIRAPVERPAPAPRAGGGRVALMAPAGPFRSSLAAMVRDWGAEVHEAETLPPAPAGGWTAILRDVGEAEARRLASAPEPAPDWARTIALVPLALDGDLRAVLRTRFRALLSKPVRSAPLLSILTGAMESPVPEAARARFAFRVLVAEDNPVNQRLIRHMLESFGCRTTVVENGREALAALTAEPGGHDLVVLDMHMPELDGIDVLRAIRSGAAGPGIRDLWVAAVSADVRAEQRAAAVDAGLDEYLVKPISLRAMEEMLLRFEGSRRRPRA
jgi:CheY-like chemotaxis protein